MPATCTCGTRLVEDSLFCHTCGKPQREIEFYQPETTGVEPPPLPPVVIEPLPVARLDFRNPIAVRVAFTVALVATLLSWIPAIAIPLWGGAGYFAVVLYRRSTGALLNVKSGLQLGWITGVLLFGLTAIAFTLSLLPAASNGGLSAIFKQQMQTQIKDPNDPRLQEVLRLLDTASGQIVIVLAMLVMLFVMITVLSMAGGALGAKYAQRSR
jgi:hypothetical protein